MRKSFTIIIAIAKWIGGIVNALGFLATVFDIPEDWQNANTLLANLDGFLTNHPQLRGCIAVVCLLGFIYITWNLTKQYAARKAPKGAYSSARPAIELLALHYKLFKESKRDKGFYLTLASELLSKGISLVLLNEMHEKKLIEAFIVSGTMSNQPPVLNQPFKSPLLPITSSVILTDEGLVWIKREFWIDCS